MKDYVLVTVVVSSLFINIVMFTVNKSLTEEKKELRQKIRYEKKIKKRMFNRNIKLKEQIIEERQKSKEIERKQKVTRSPHQKGREYIGEFIVTAYDDSPRSQGKWVGQTATGVKPQVGIVAVDPSIIPLGSKLYIEDYGECIAGDTGGAIKGSRIDVFLNTYEECIKWGRQKKKVYKIV